MIAVAVVVVVVIVVTFVVLSVCLFRLCVYLRACISLHALSRKENIPKKRYGEEARTRRKIHKASVTMKNCA